MKKLLWRLYRRLYLWYVYRGEELPWDEKPEPYRCPNCNWDPEESHYDNNKVFLGSTNLSFSHDGSQNWTEHYKCPKCGTRFSFDTGN